MEGGICFNSKPKENREILSTDRINFQTLFNNAIDFNGKINFNVFLELNQPISLKFSRKFFLQPCDSVSFVSLHFVQTIGFYYYIKNSKSLRHILPNLAF